MDYHDNEGGYTRDEEPGRKRTETLIPVTIKQLHCCDQQAQGEFYVDGQLIHNITLVGMIMNVNKTMNAVTYEVEDGTGRIEAKLWVDSNNEEDNSEHAIATHTYVRLYGQFRIFNDKKSVNCFKIKEISDFNEITYHLLQTTYVHIYHLNLANNLTSNDTYIDNHNANNQYGYADNQNQQYNAEDVEELLNHSIIEIIQSKNSTKQGAHIKFIVNQMRMKFDISEEDIFQRIEQLCGEGLVWTTIDEHFAA